VLIKKTFPEREKKCFDGGRAGTTYSTSWKKKGPAGHDGPVTWLATIQGKPGEKGRLVEKDGKFEGLRGDSGTISMMLGADEVRMLKRGGGLGGDAGQSRPGSKVKCWRGRGRCEGD